MIRRGAGVSRILLPLLLLAAAGCHRDEVKVYRVAKDENQSQQPAAQSLPTDSPNPGLPPGHPDISSAAGGAQFPAPTGLPQLTWKTPAGWTEVPAGEMRVASFKVTGPDGKQADVSVIPLPGEAGTDEANVNRWRGQLGLSPASADKINKSAQAVEAGGQPAQLYDIPGPNPPGGDAQRILAVIQRRDNIAWFYKVTGDSALVEQQKPALVDFLKSLAFGAPAAPATMPAAMPANHPDMGGMGMPMAAQNVASGPTPTPNWQVPANWQPAPAGQFLVAKFTIAGSGGGQADVNVSNAGGTGGGVIANVNRWRAQLGLAPLPDADVQKSLTTLDAAAGKASVADLSGTDVRTGQATRLIGVIVPQADQTWFYKLMGDDKVVESQKAAFIQFVKSAK